MSLVLVFFIGKFLCCSCEVFFLLSRKIVMPRSIKVLEVMCMDLVVLQKYYCDLHISLDYSHFNCNIKIV